jgi:nucleoside-diphosphate-sugar epimerase
LSKLAAEELVELYARERSVPATVLRYFTVYGPRQRPEMASLRFIFAASRGRPVKVYGDGEQIRELTYVSDAVGATVAALEAAPGGTYNIGGGARVSVNELLGCVGRALGMRVEARYGPEAEGTCAPRGRIRGGRRGSSAIVPGPAWRRGWRPRRSGRCEKAPPPAPPEHLVSGALILLILLYLVGHFLARSLTRKGDGWAELALLRVAASAAVACRF